MSNDFAFSNTITRGIANISRAENRPMDAIAADLMHAEVWGGGAGRTVIKTKPAKALCSFRGDMLVETQNGYKPIADIKIGDMVLAKNEFTGEVSYQKVLNQYNNPYQQTVYVTLTDKNGNSQTIVSNKIHPFFTRINNLDGLSLPPSSEGHNYQGDIKNAQWVDASNLKAGYELLSEDGKWQVVQHVEVKDEPLSAYNLTVGNDHTYFIAGNYKVRGVWVHNNCWNNLPSGATNTGKTLPDGRPLYTFKDEKGKQVLAYKGSDGRYYNKDVYHPTKPNSPNVIAVDSYPNRIGAKAAPGHVYYQTDAEAFEAAKKLGYTKKHTQKNRPAIFENPNTGEVISRDVGTGKGEGAHNGGVWKKADSIKNINKKETRDGTYDANLKRIGD
ncbi:polymorphic toxin-type HINT domain-containing protein [Faucicola mancuniensis]|uniref:polymorphic toxin-type HINT domain-containing protein n=1 Tax=Faucicola mancuniensis TaxID=1309795 RepID=UPI003977B83A